MRLHVLDRLHENGDVVMVNFFSGFIHPEAAKILVESQVKYLRLREEALARHGSPGE